jgi:hypothetical protein
MKIISNENTKLSKENNRKDIEHLQASFGSQGSPTPIAEHPSESDIDLNQKDFDINENKQSSSDLVRPRHSPKHKFAPYTKSQRRLRRSEVYKLHFEHGMPATRIAEIMDVDRNTINNDLKALYQKAINDYNPENMDLDEIVEKQLVRLETQRDRLGLYLCDVKDVNTKITIERLIADVDFKLLGTIEKVNHNSSRYWNNIIKEVNKMAEINNISLRYTSLFELKNISIDSRKSLDEIRDQAFKEKKK